MNDDRGSRMLSLIKQYHAGQFRNNGRVPYWHHCVSVGEIIFDAFIRTNELDDNQRLLSDFYLAALGHDLYEDTSIDRLVVRDHFGDRVDEWIQCLTNEQDDDHREEYLRKLDAAPEEPQLIKLADVIDNLLSCAYGIHDLGADWVRMQYRPHAEEVRTMMSRQSFKQYPRTANVLLFMLEFAWDRLEENLQKQD